MARICESWAAVAFAGLALAAGAAGAQDLPVIPAKASPEPVDRLADAAEVSAARIVVGVMLEPLTPPSRGPLVIAELPSAWGGSAVCARLISGDALYEGRAEYDISETEAGRRAELRFQIAPRHWKKLEEDYGGKLVVAVTRGGCQEPSDDHAVALWRTTGSIEWMDT